MIIFNKRIAGLCALLFLFLTGCREKVDEPKAKTASLRLSYVDSSSRLKQLGRSGDAFFVQVVASDSWHIELQPADAAEWIRILPSAQQGEATTGRNIAVEVRYNTAQERRAMIVAKMGRGIADTLQLVQQAGTESHNDNPPTNETIPSGEHIIGGDMSLVELPRLYGGDNNYFVTHRVSDGTVNYSYEYDVKKGHSRWVAFSFDAKTSARRVTGRSNEFRWDPKMPAEYAIEDNMFKKWYPHHQTNGYDRGHLVASNDRRFSREAEDQTYYYTNISPQTSTFNQGYWQQLEAQVQSWGRDDRFRDVLYVAKGGTIADGQYDRAGVNVRMVKPRYYWMAVVVKRGLNHRAIAFWLAHNKDYSRNPPLIDYAISIDELESKTGLDLFHNLEDELEARIERDKPVARHWPGL